MLTEGIGVLILIFRIDGVRVTGQRLFENKQSVTTITFQHRARPEKGLISTHEF
jgi:hypothetical protein